MMDSMYLLIVITMCLGFAGWMAFLWALKSGQYDDIEGPKHRMLEDEDFYELERIPVKTDQDTGSIKDEAKEKS